MSWADRVLTEAVEAAATTGDRRLAAHALVQRGFLRLFTESGSDAARADRGRRARDRRLRGARRRARPRARLAARGPGALPRPPRRRVRGSSERALEHARRAGDRFEEREIVEWLVIALFLGPTPARRPPSAAEQLLAETAGNAAPPGARSWRAGALVAMLGRVDEADELIARSRAIMSELGEWIWIGSFWHAFVSVLAGRSRRRPSTSFARPTTRSRRSARRATSPRSLTRSRTPSILQGRYDEAEQLTRECEEASRPNDVHSQILWRSIRAKVLARKGDWKRPSDSRGRPSPWSRQRLPPRPCRRTDGSCRGAGTAEQA